VNPGFNPGSRFSSTPHSGSRISDPTRIKKKREKKKICFHTFFYSHKFHKIVNYFIFEKVQKKIEPTEK
jgi:hypothetical protein